MFSWTMNSRKRVLSASLTLLYFFLGGVWGMASVESWRGRRGRRDVCMSGGKD